MIGPHENLCSLSMAFIPLLKFSVMQGSRHGGMHNMPTLSHCQAAKGWI